MLFLLLTLLTISESYQASMPEIHPKAIHANAIQSTMKVMRKKKAHIPYALHIHHPLITSLHVIPLHHIHAVHTEISVVNTHPHNNTVSSQLIPLLIPLHPIHNIVPVHDLTVIPLQSVPQAKSYVVDDDDEDRYRNPLGGYGVGWGFGGHGAGHGFHYSYG